MTPVDLILWRAMVTAARREAAHHPPPIASKAGLGRLLRQTLRTVMVMSLDSRIAWRRGTGMAKDKETRR